MCIRVVNLKVPNSCMNDIDVTGIEYNLTYKVLNLIASNNGITRSQIKKQIPVAWRILKRAVRKGWIVRQNIGRNNEYFISETGLDKIDIIKIKYNVYTG